MLLWWHNVYQMQKKKSLPTGMAEVVTAVAWEECDAIVMVTIVLLVIWVCGTVPKNNTNKKRFKKNCNKELDINREKTTTYRGGWGYCVCGNNRCHSGCSHWCDRAEDWLLWTEIKKADLHLCTEWLRWCRRDSSGCINLCHGVCGLWFLSPNCRVRWQCDPCACVTSCLRSLNADSSWRRVNSQTLTPERTQSL